MVFAKRRRPVPQRHDLCHGHLSGFRWHRIWSSPIPWVALSTPPSPERVTTTAHTSQPTTDILGLSCGGCTSTIAQVVPGGKIMAVASDGTVYLLLIGHPNGLYWVFQARGEDRLADLWNPAGLSGDRASHLLKIQPYHPTLVVAQSSIGLSGSGACDLKHLLLIGNTLLFASGEFHTSIVSNLNAVIAGLSLPNLLFSITSLTNTNERGLLVRWNLAAHPDLSSPTAA